MKKVIFGRASDEVVHIDDLGSRKIVGYVLGDVKGIVVYDEGQGTYIAISLVIGDSSQDRIGAYVSQSIKADSIHVNQFIIKVGQDKEELIEFFIFDNMMEFFNWIS